MVIRIVGGEGWSGWIGDGNVYGVEALRARKVRLDEVLAWQTNGRLARGRAEGNGNIERSNGRRTGQKMIEDEPQRPLLCIGGGNALELFNA